MPLDWCSCGLMNGSIFPEHECKSWLGAWAGEGAPCQGGGGGALIRSHQLRDDPNPFQCAGLCFWSAGSHGGPTEGQSSRPAAKRISYGHLYAQTAQTLEGHASLGEGQDEHRVWTPTFEDGARAMAAMAKFPCKVHGLQGHRQRKG